ncbi:hypothetical protein VDGL01_12372 [Verticillium dahliae]
MRLPKAIAALYILPASQFEPSQIRSRESLTYLISRIFHL